jgi:hypothetical protein
MPNRYEREIEEILRNLEQTEPRGARGSRSAGSGRARAGRERRISMPRPRLSSLNVDLDAAQWFLILSIAAALIGGGVAYTQDTASVFTGVMAAFSTLCLILVLVIPFLGRPRYSAQGGRYAKVTPLSRNPLSSLATRWHLFLLKLRYRRRRDL